MWIECVFCHKHFYIGASICDHLEIDHLSQFNNRSFVYETWLGDVHLRSPTKIIVTTVVYKHPQLMLLNILDMKQSEKSIIDFYNIECASVKWNDLILIIFRTFNYSCIICGKIYETGIPSMELVNKHMAMCLNNYFWGSIN